MLGPLGVTDTSRGLECSHSPLPRVLVDTRGETEVVHSKERNARLSQTLPKGVGAGAPGSEQPQIRD